jgi:hypothetical protein
MKPKPTQASEIAHVREAYRKFAAKHGIKTGKWKSRPLKK